MRELSNLMPAISSRGVRSRAEEMLDRLRSRSHDAELQADCTAALARIKQATSPGTPVASKVQSLPGAVTAWFWLLMGRKSIDSCFHITLSRRGSCMQRSATGAPCCHSPNRRIECGSVLSKYARGRSGHRKPRLPWFAHVFNDNGAVFENFIPAASVYQRRPGRC